MNISDVMTRDVEIARPTDTIQAVAQKMASGDFGFMPVCDGRKIQGVITDRATITRMLAATASGDRELQLRTAWEVNVAPAFAADESAYAAFRERALAAPAPPAVVLEQLKATAVHDASVSELR